jgi:transcriptional regulator with XRE-family HTH domain
VLELANCNAPSGGVDSRIVKSRDVFRERVRALAEQSGKTPSAMAQELGHSSSWISQLFSGRRGAFFTTIDEIATYLKVPPATLFGGPQLGTDRAGATDGRNAVAETKGDEDATDLARRGGGNMADDLGESLLTTLGLVPAEHREEFVTHCFHTAMTWRKARHAATGTEGPKG